MASLVLKSNYSVNYKPNLTAVPVDLRYDPENGNVELVQQGLGGQVLYKNGEFTDQGNATIQVNETGTSLEASISNDVRAAAARVDGKIQPWAQNPNTENPNPRDRGPGSGSTSADSTIPSADLFSNLADKFTDKKEKEKYSKWNLMYPNSMDSQQDRIIIQQIQYTPGLTVTPGTENTSNNTVIRGENRFETIIGSVTLPMTNDLSETNGVGWGEDSLSNFAALGMPGFMRGANATSDGNFGQAAKDFLGAGRQMLLNSGSAARIQQYFVANAAAGALKLLNINVNPEAYLTRVTGAAVNPNLELLFNGPKLRQFGLTFKMTPRSTDEAKSIRGIIQFFKKGMTPRRSSDQTFSFFLGTPNVFKIKFMGSGNNELKSIGKFKTSALLSFSVNYTPDGFYAAYEDAFANGSQPVAVIMQMTFTELTPVFSDEHDLDDDTVNLGPTEFSDDFGLSSTGTPLAVSGAPQGPAGEDNQ